MSERRTLAIDIGGTGIKAALLDEAGTMLGERVRAETPAKPVPRDALLDAVVGLVRQLPGFDRVSVGFPGVVRDGKLVTAPNLGTEELAGFDLQGALEQSLGKPVRVLNDADVQGYGAVRGAGLEMVLTLGTGAGTALFRDGMLLPHLEFAHHPVHGDKTYDEYIGKAAFEKKGKKAWSKRVFRVVGILRTVVGFDHLYLGGGNARELVGELPRDVSIVPNSDGLTGGIALWRAEDAAPRPPAAAAAPAPRPASKGRRAPKSRATKNGSAAAGETPAEAG
jgi:polyphosphate glucokinase